MVLYTIYEIACKDESIQNVYIGHTKNFTRRRSKHMNDYKSKKYKFHNFIKQHGGWDNWEMKKIEEIECDKLEARKMEQSYINKNNTQGMNSNRAFISDSKFYLEKKLKTLIKDTERRKVILMQLEKFLENPNDFYTKNYEKYKKQAEGLQYRINRQEETIQLINENIDKFL